MTCANLVYLEIIAPFLINVGRRNYEGEVWYSTVEVNFVFFSFFSFKI